MNTITVKALAEQLAWSNWATERMKSSIWMSTLWPTQLNPVCMMYGTLRMARPLWCWGNPTPFACM